MKFGYFCNTTNWTHKPYYELLDETKEITEYCDQNDWDSIWYTEHHFNHEGMESCTNPLMMGADAALLCHFKTNLYIVLTGRDFLESVRRYLVARVGTSLQTLPKRSLDLLRRQVSEKQLLHDIDCRIMIFTKVETFGFNHDRLIKSLRIQKRSWIHAQLLTAFKCDLLHIM